MMKQLKDIRDWKECINEVVCGDSLDLMKMIPDNAIDLCLTDPPYGIKLDKGFSGASGFGGKGKKIPRRQYSDDWDTSRPSKEYFDEILRISKIAIIFGGNYFADILPLSTHWIVWDKLNTMPTFSDCELIWTNSKRKSVKKFTFQYNGLIGKEEFRKHPTQKPIELMRWCLENYAKDCKTVIDPFAGSFTTARACKDMGFDWIEIDKEEKYCHIGDKRLEQQNLF